MVSFGFCSFRETPRSGVADAICSGLLARSYSEPSRRMYCSPPTVLSLLRSRLSTTWVSVGSTTPLSSRPAWLLLLSGCGVGVGVGSTWGGVVASSLPPQAAVPRAMRTAIVKLFSFIVSFHSIRDIPDCYGFRFERLRATQRFVLRCPLLGFNSRAHFRFCVALFWLQTPPIPSDSPPLKMRIRVPKSLKYELSATQL